MDPWAWVDLAALSSLPQEVHHLAWEAAALLVRLGILVVVFAAILYVALGVRLVWIMERVRNYR